MPSLIVNLPTGEQARIEIDDTGDYYDQSKVLWDSRTDGPVPANIELGKMQRVGGNLIKAATVLDEHANAVYQRNLPIEVPYTRVGSRLGAVRLQWNLAHSRWGHLSALLLTEAVLLM